MTDAEIVRKTWGFVRLDDREAVEYIRAEAGPALERLETERDRLRGELAYAVECGSLGVVPNWSALSEEDRDEWIVHAKEEDE